MNIDELIWNVITGLSRVYNKGLQDGQSLGKKKTKRRSFSKKTKQAVLLSQGFRCRSCRGILNVREFDHIDGNSANNRTNNCQALCPNCHAILTKFRRKRKM